MQQAAATAQSLADQHNLLIDFAIALAIVAVLAVLLGWFVAGRMLRPVRTITATARRISASNLHERLALDDADEEFQQLGDTLDDLFARLEAAFEAQQHFVANASHELRTPLTAERALCKSPSTTPRTSNDDVAIHRPTKRSPPTTSKNASSTPSSLWPAAKADSTTARDLTCR